MNIYDFLTVINQELNCSEEEIYIDEDVSFEPAEDHKIYLIMHNLIINFGTDGHKICFTVGFNIDKCGIDVINEIHDNVVKLFATFKLVKNNKIFYINSFGGDVDCDNVIIYGNNRNNKYIKHQYKFRVTELEDHEYGRYCKYI